LLARMRTPRKARHIREGYFAEKQARSLFVSDATRPRFACRRRGFEKVCQPMLRTLFIGVFLSLYILVVGPPLLVYTLNHPQS